MKYIDLFAGIGGFHLGISKAQNWECVYSNEWDKYANSVYRKHYGECDNRDIRTVRAEEIPDHDLLCGGFPCQSFSVAGKRGGFEDTRGTLFFEIARIAQKKRPHLLLLENVKGLLSHDSGRTFGVILSTLDELGYDCQWQVLNSKNFGVPQNRERVFIIGHLRGTSRPQVFPLGKNDNPLITKGKKQASTAIISRTLTATDAKMHLDGNYIKQINNPTHSNDRVYGNDGISPTLNTMQGGRRQPKIVIPVLTPDRPEKRQNGRRFKENGEPSFTLTGQDKHGVLIVNKKGKSKNKDYASTLTGGAHSGGNHSDMDLLVNQSIRNGIQIRRLTPIECEKLQGFPPNWTQYGVDGELISDTQRYKMCGNAVTTNVITAIVERLK